MYATELLIVLLRCTSHLPNQLLPFKSSMNLLCFTANLFPTTSVTTSARVVTLHLAGQLYVVGYKSNTNRQNARLRTPSNRFKQMLHVLVSDIEHTVLALL